MFFAKQETSYSRGVWAEEQAESYLYKLGYKILNRRYKTKFGEVDLITKKDNIICFVEVKARENKCDALESITRRSQKRIENSALFFISENPDFMNYDLRFDVVVISSSNNSSGFEIMHLDNAWEASS